MSAAQSDPVKELLDDTWRFRVDTTPALQMAHGITVERLPDFSETTVRTRAEFAAAGLARLDATDDDALAPDSRLSARVLRRVFSDEVAAEQHYWSELLLTPYQFGFRVRALIAPVFRSFRFDSKEHAYRYEDLVRDYARVVRSLHDKTLGQADGGIRIPKAALPGVRTTLAGMRDASAGLLALHPSRLVAMSRSSAYTLGRNVDRIIETEVIPAYDALLALLGEDYEVAAPDDVGAAQRLGENYYRYCVERETTLDHRPEELHHRGLDECAQLSEQMAEIRSKLGFTGTEAEFRRHLRRESHLYAKDVGELGARYRHHLDAVAQQLPNYFHTLPEAPFEVERIDPALEAAMAFGYYDGPSQRRPSGVYYYNGSDLANRSLLGAAALIYRELVPGAHLQAARLFEDTTLHPLRREGVRFLGYVEAWAGYGAALADEMGLYENLYDRYGWLAARRFTAMRLAADTGLNLYGWTLDKAHEFMSTHSDESQAMIAAEALRYSTDLPGQALGYGAGYDALAGYRSSAQERLRARFDLRDFHEFVLGNGELPLNVLGVELAQWSHRK